MPLVFTVDVNDPEQNGLVADFTQSGIAQAPDFVRGENIVPYTVRPVVKPVTGTRPWDDDFATGDTFRVSIGLPDAIPTGGTFRWSISGLDTGLKLLPFDITATALELLFSPAAIESGNPGATVAKLSSGAFLVTGIEVGAMALIVADASDLQPACQSIVTEIQVGDLVTKSQQLIQFKQQPVALSVPSTALTAAGVTRVVAQAADATHNKIYRISFDAVGTYGGLYSITAIANAITASCGSVSPVASAAELGLALANHPQIHYRTSGSTDNVIVTKDGADFLIEFVDNLKLTADPTITVANVSLLAPKGVTGELAINTTNLARAFWNTPENELTYELSIYRERLSGDKETILLVPVTLRRDLVDITSLIALTTNEPDARYVRKGPSFGVMVWNSDLAIYEEVTLTGALGSEAFNPSISPSFSAQVANTVFSGPTSGGVTTPTFRALVNADIPTALTGKTYNGLTVTSSTGTITIAALKVATFSNTITVAGTDGGTLNVGAGGTLGTAAFTAATAYVAAAQVTGGGVLATGGFTLTIAGTASVNGTNTGDNTVNTLYSGLVSNATHTGDATGATVLTLATVNSNVGSFGSATQVVTLTVNGKGLVTAAANVTITPAVGSITGFGSGVATALAAALDGTGGLASKSYADGLVVGLWDLRGATDASANPNYPSALKGDVYVITVAGKVGGASGKSVDVSDVIVATADNAGGTEASVGTSWAALEHNLIGALLAANNLSDLGSASTARTNLGLGSVENTALSTWAGTANITTVGTLAAGAVPTTLLTGTITNAQLAGSIAYSKLSLTGAILNADLSGGITEAKQTLADNTTADVSTSAHGYAPKAPSDATKFLNGANPPAWTVPAGGAAVANPGAQVLGLTAINGSASTAMRSDGAPALNQAIAPTWTGIHTFTSAVTSGTTTTSGIAITANSLTSGTALDLSTTTTTAAAGSNLLNISASGTNATSAITTTAATIANTHAGTTSTNIGLTLTASGGTTANTALNVTAGKVVIATGTLLDLAIGFSFTTTLVAVATGLNVGFKTSVTGAGSSNQAQIANDNVFNSGYTGANTTIGLRNVNNSAGTQVGAFATSGNISHSPGGNLGTTGRTESTTVGDNFGGMFLAGGGTVNVGVWSSSTSSKASAKNIGVIGIGVNPNATSPVSVGGYFATLDGGTSLPTFTSAALICENGTQAIDIFVARDNGTAVCTIADGGAMTLTSSLAIGSGTAITKVLGATATLDFASTLGLASADLTVTVTGAADGDRVCIGCPNASVPANGSFFGWVSATNTVTIRYLPLVTGDPASGVFKVTVFQM